MKNKHLKETGQRFNNPVTYGVILLSIWFFVPSLLMDLWLIDVREVTVDSPITEDAPITMEVDRTVKREFRGTFEVQIRRTDGELVCTGSPERPISYMTGVELPHPLVLTWWLGGQDQMRECERKGFGLGEYMIDTCHTMVITPMNIPFATRCVRSNRFVVIPEETEERTEE